MRQSTVFFDEFLTVSFGKMFSNPEVDSLFALKIWISTSPSYLTVTWSSRARSCQLDRVIVWTYRTVADNRNTPQPFWPYCFGVHFVITGTQLFCLLVHTMSVVHCALFVWPALGNMVVSRTVLTLSPCVCQHKFGGLSLFYPGPFSGTQVWSIVFLLGGFALPEWRCPWPAAMPDATPFCRLDPPHGVRVCLT